MPTATTQSELDRLWSAHASRWRRLLSRRAITELKLRASFDLDLLTPARIANRIPHGTIPDCAACDDICCAGVENVVSLRLRDIAVLIDVGRTDLISKKKPRFSQALTAQRPALAELMHSELYRTLPVMRQVTELRICAALTPQMQCSLYPHWPLSCERFPYTLRARREVVWGTRCATKRVDADHQPRREAMFEAAVATFNERVKDAVLLAHARDGLEAIGMGAFLCGPNEDPFESASSRLPVVD